MNRAYSAGAFAPQVTEACPGDVFGWFRPKPIGKEKYHLCLSFDHDFTFLNTPSDRSHFLDHQIAAHHIRFLKPTRTRFSSVSCTNLQAIGDERRFLSFKPRHLGNLATDALFPLLRHIIDLETTSPEEAERLVDVIRIMEGPMRPPPGRPGRPTLRR